MTGAKHMFLTMLSIVLLASPGTRLFAQTQQQPSDSNSSSSSASTQESNSKPAASAAPNASPSKPAAPPASSASTAPPAKPAAGQQAPAANGGGLVWVNTDSGVYHKPGTRWYGKTKKGKYMTEADARKAGYKPAAKE